jgi:hypothetical protein
VGEVETFFCSLERLWEVVVDRLVLSWAVELLVSAAMLLFALGQLPLLLLR